MKTVGLNGAGAANVSSNPQSNTLTGKTTYEFGIVTDDGMNVG